MDDPKTTETRRRLLAIHVPGIPVAQGRARTRVIQRDGKAIAINYDPKKSRDWKATAQQHMKLAMELGGWSIMAGPVQVAITALFECPRSSWRKRDPVPETWCPKKPDIDNIAKAVFDAGNGLVWLDDRQIVSLAVVKRQAAQGHPPGLFIVVEEIQTIA